MKDDMKLLSVFATAGAILMIAGTMWHPMEADPNIAMHAFQEYSASEHWIASHLLQLFGVIFITAALALLFPRFLDGKPKAWALLGWSGAIASLAIFAALQAVDGIALKAMVDDWSAAAGTEKSVLFQAALSVRRIEMGLASMASIVSGLSFIAYGIAFVADARSAMWIAILAILGGILTFIGGIVIAYTGFSPLSMLINMPASILLVIWFFVIGIKAWRHSLLQPDKKPA